MTSIPDFPSVSYQEEDLTTPIAPLFVRQYSIIKGIMEQLPIKDLLSAAKVCREWSEVARVVRRLRKNRTTTFLWHPYGNHTQEVFEYYNGHAVSSEVMSFMNSAPAHGFPSVQELTEDQSWSNLFPQLRAAVMKEFFSAYYEPQFMVVVGTAAIDEYMPSDEDNSTKLKMILSEIPKAVPCLVSFSYGVVASLEGQQKSLEMEKCEVPLLGLLSIPKVPGMLVKMFTVTKETNNKYKGKVTSENCKEILNIDAEDNVKAIILFHTDVRKAGSLRDAVFQYIKNNPNVALGGGAHYKNLASVCQGDFVPVAAGLIICGNENVRASSVGLFDSKISKRNEDKLVEMKGCEFQDGDSFAFMFACNGRGAGMHGSTHVESTLFRKHFPRTSLVGTFTGGEYCHEVLPRRTLPEPPKKPSNVEFAYTTVFVLVSFRHPVKNATRHA